MQVFNIYTKFSKTRRNILEKKSNATKPFSKLKKIPCETL